MLHTFLKDTTREAAAEYAKKYSADNQTTVYVYWHSADSNYSATTWTNPYAPIIAGGYVPSLEISFTNGKQNTNSEN